jgi:protein-S-isoprenylcysteine O-methyltransferase Ste14
MQANMDNLLTVGLLAVALTIAGAVVFRRAAYDYEHRGRLTPTSSALEIVLFILHGAASLVFLESRFSAIDTGNPLFGFALVLAIGGLVLLVTTLGRFGVRKAAGHDVSGLTCSGIYRKSRNPQIIFYGIAVAGYSLLWPSWTGALWVVVYAVLAAMMVRTEEKHLKNAYGEEYVDYCTRTPRYMDLPGMK